MSKASPSLTTGRAASPKPPPLRIPAKGRAASPKPPRRIPVVVMVDPADINRVAKLLISTAIARADQGLPYSRGQEASLRLQMQLIHNARTRGRCQVCGCTDAHACPGGCAWANAKRTLCTACVRRLIRTAGDVR
ncbi:MAG: hypothetical protein V1929_00195 [bacterium]